MKARLLLVAVIVTLTLAGAVPAGAEAIESELVLITPVSKFVVDAVLEAFQAYARREFGINVRASAIHAGTPVSYGRIVEWAGRPQADIFWGGESALFDDLRDKGLLAPLQMPPGVLERIPFAVGAPSPLPIRDQNGYWTGTMFTPYGLIYNPRVMRRLGMESISDWDDLLDPRLKGWVAQSTPDRSSSNHASYEVIFQLLGWDKGWEWAERLGAQTNIFAARSRDVPTQVARGEAAVGFAVPNYMAFEEVLAGFDLRFVYPSYAFITPEPMAALANSPNPKAAQAFIAFLLSEEGQLVVATRGTFPIIPGLRVKGEPGSSAEKAVEFMSGVRSVYELDIRNIYDDGVAQARYSEVNDLFRRRVVERHAELKRQY